MKVLVVYHAGAGAEAKAIFEELGAQPGIDLHVIVPRAVTLAYGSERWLSLDSVQEHPHFRLIPVPLRHPDDYMRGFRTRALQRWLREIRPDVIHALDEIRSGCVFQLTWQSLLSVPFSKVLFYGFENIHKGFRFGFLSRLKWRATYGLVAGGAVASYGAAELARDLGFRNMHRVERIFWGVSEDHFMKMNQSDVRRDLGLRSSKIVGFIGRLVPEKGIVTLIEAMVLLPDEVECLLLGEGGLDITEVVRVRGLAERIHRVANVERDELPKWINAMDVLALPSLSTEGWKEQFGRVLAEAMACGLPVVGSSSGAIPEVINGGGLIVPEGDAEALAKALGTCLYDETLRERFTAEGRKWVQNELGTHAMAIRLRKLYQRVIGQSL